MRLSGLAAGAAGLLLAGALTGCSSTVAGEGSLAAPDSSESTQPTEDSEPTGSTEPTGTSAPTETDDDALDCPDQSVSPAGSPYCYTAPAGLDEVQLGDPTAGESGSFQTSYGFGPTDHIQVHAYVVGVDTDELTDDDITGELSGVIEELESGGFEFDRQPRPLLVDGDARTFAYDGRSVDGEQDIVAHFIFRGLNEVQINCSSTADTAEVIDAACAEVLDSFQIVG